MAKTWWLRKRLTPDQRSELRTEIMKVDVDAYWEEHETDKSIISLGRLNTWIQPDEKGTVIVFQDNSLFSLRNWQEVVKITELESGPLLAIKPIGGIHVENIRLIKNQKVSFKIHSDKWKNFDTLILSEWFIAGFDL
jgi:hypothetical protein